MNTLPIKCLGFGSTGQLGQVWQNLSGSAYEVQWVGRDQCDLADPQQVNRFLRTCKNDFQLLLNASAYTDVEGAEDHRRLAYDVNEQSVGCMAEWCRTVGVPMIHYSTDYVFDGRGDEPYTEDQAPHPLNVYGASKLAGERAIEQVGCDALILRTSWVYSPFNKNFLKTMVRLFQERDQVQVVADQIGVPNEAHFLVRTSQAIVDQWMKQERKGPEIFHLSASGQASWYEFATAIYRAMDSSRVREVRIIPIDSSAYPTKAQRPQWSVLGTQKLRQRFGLDIHDWLHYLPDSLSRVLM